MSQVALVISRQVKGPSVDNMRTAFEEADQPVVEIDMPPFETRLPMNLPDDMPEAKFVYGFTTLVTAAKRHRVLSDGVYYSESKFRPSTTAMQFPASYAQRDAIFGTPGTLSVAAGERPLWFFKSNDDLKELPGSVMTWEQFKTLGIRDRWYLMAPPMEPPASEWRVWMVDGEPAMIRPYGGSRHPAPDDLLRACRQWDAVWRPADVYCIDVADLGDRLAIMEHTCANWAGVNGAEPAREFVAALVARPGPLDYAVASVDEKFHAQMQAVLESPPSIVV